MDIEDKIADIQEQLNALKAATTIPYEIDQAFRTRFDIAALARLVPSTKTVASETQAVSEAGVGSYNVPKIFDEFRQFTIGGTTYYIGLYT
jgi:hypothetical protein